MKLMNRLKNKTALYWLTIFATACFGGFYDWAAMMLTVCICVCGIVKIVRTGKCYSHKNPSVYAVYLLAISSVLSLVLAIDRGMAFVGVLHYLPILSWLCLNMQYEEQQREDALDGVTDAGVLAVLITGGSYFVPGLKDWFWMADRLGGSLQYSNTFAIFLLMGMVVATRKLVTGKEWFLQVKWGILVVGILLTGSRTVLLLVLGVLAYEWIGKGKTVEQKKSLRVRNGITICLGVLGAVVMVGITGSYQNMARLATIFTSNSTMYGRLLYWQDALPQILKHPLGMGYLGYSYAQGAFQTGVYRTMFVHNDFLQAFLDNGFLGGIALIGLFGMQIRKSKYRELWVVLALHCLVDFDLQYPLMWMIVLLLCNYGKEGELLKKDGRREQLACLGIVSVIAIFFLIPFSYYYLDQYEKSLYFYPAYTIAKEPLVYDNVAYADAILQQNSYSVLAWDAKAYEAYRNGDIQSFVTYKQEVLKKDRYAINQFQNYVDLLEQCARISESEQLQKQAQFCREAEQFAPQFLQQVEKETSNLAYMIRDIPNFDLNMP